VLDWEEVVWNAVGDIPSVDSIRRNGRLPIPTVQIPTLGCFPRLESEIKSGEDYQADRDRASRTNVEKMLKNYRGGRRIVEHKNQCPWGIGDRYILEQHKPDLARRMGAVDWQRPDKDPTLHQSGFLVAGLNVGISVHLLNH